MTIAMLLAGCSSSDTAAPTQTACVAGQQVACSYGAATMGAQRCKSDGSGFEACSCNAPSADNDASTAQDSGPGGSPSQPIGQSEAGRPIPDAASEAATTHDAAQSSDAGGPVRCDSNPAVCKSLGETFGCKGAYNVYICLASCADAGCTASQVCVSAAPGTAFESVCVERCGTQPCDGAGLACINYTDLDKKVAKACLPREWAAISLSQDK